MALHGLFHASSHIKSELLGVVQDFCPICREMRSFTSKNYYSERQMRLFLVISISEGREGGLGVTECGECKSRWRTLDGIATRGRKGSAEARQRLEERRALEERAKARSTTPEEREWLLQEPFLRMASMAKIQEAIGKPDTASSIGCFSIFILSLAWAAAIAAFREGKVEKAEPWQIASMMVLCIPGLATAYAWLTRRSRYVRRELESRLARSLEPLSPTKVEVIAAVEQIRRQEPKFAKRIDGGRIHDRMGSAFH